MKFLAAAIAVLLTIANAAKAPDIRNKRVDKRKLLSKAIPVDRNGNRRLDGENEFEITAAHSIVFSECLSLRTQPDEDGEEIMFSNNNLEYTMNGQIVSQKSFVLFNICETEYCGYDEDDASMYMVELADYLGSLIEFYPDKVINYCEACQEATDYCLYGDEEEQAEEEEGEEEEEEDGEEDEEDRRRRLAKKQRKLNKKRKLEENVQYVDCDECANRNCFEYEGEDENNNGQDDDYDFAEWVAQMAECQQIELEDDGNNNGNDNGDDEEEQQLYASFMCNEDGDGVEIAVFYDEECSIYTALESYSSLVANSEDYWYVQNSVDIVTYPFSNAIDCSENNEFESPENMEDEDEDENQDEQEEEEEQEASEYCRGLMEGDYFNDIADCGYGDEDEEEDAAEEEDENQENNNYYNYYSYHVSQNNLESAQAICMVIQAFEGEYSEAHVYYGGAADEEGGSGTIYDYGGNSSTSAEAGANAGKIVGIVLLVIALIVGAVLAIQALTKKKADSKKTPLVAGKGAMA